MESTKFDRWTRRRFGQVAGSALGLSLGGIPLLVSARKHKKKKKKQCVTSACVEPGGTCNPSGSECCDCHSCTQGSDGIYRCSF